MIRALRGTLRTPGGRRVAAFLALGAFLLLVLAGSAHAASDDDHHGSCDVCIALATVLAAELPAAPSLTGVVAPVRPDAARPADAPPEPAFVRSHAPRGPPAVR